MATSVEGWRELPWSMSWLRPGDKFDKRTYLSKTLIVKSNNDFTKEGLGLKNGVKRNTRVRCKLAVSHNINKEGNLNGNIKHKSRK